MPPLVFLHIPKTAGTSVLATLGNVFGDAGVRRLGPGELHREAIEALLASAALANIRCLAGHFPAHAFGDRLFEFPVFTVLRHPVDRVMSLYRFLRRQPAEQLARLDLPPGFGFDAFLACRAPELFGQVRNGMCDQLCNAPQQRDRTSEAFWRDTPLDEIVARAVATLERIEFGLAERMGETLARLRAVLGLSFELNEVVENASGPPGPEWTPANVLRLVELNAGDLALYHAAAALLRIRGDVPHGSAPSLELAHLPRGAAVSVRDLPGKQGFHPYEPEGGFAWVVGAGPARLVFTAAPGRVRLRLKLYRIAAGFPTQEATLALNGNEIATSWHPEGARWGVLETAPFIATNPTVVALALPYAVPVRFLAPRAEDRRQLSVALATVTLADA